MDTAMKDDATAKTTRVKLKKPKAKAETETATEKFQRLATARVETAIKKISLIGNLAGGGYHCEANEAKQVVAALQEAVDEVASKFARKAGGKKGGFSFARK